MTNVRSQTFKVVAGIRETRRRARLYRRHFGNIRGSWYGILDRPGATGSISVAFDKYPHVTVRLGNTDLRTLCHVLCQRGYEFPFLIGASPSWIVDAGANTGIATVFFAEHFPEAIIVAIEPDLDNFKMLQENTSRYGQRVHCVRAALWSHRGSVDVIDPGSGAWSMRVQESTGEVAKLNRRVLALTVDDIVEQFSIDRINILKMDIEGGESEVFQDASSWIGSVDAIAIELHDRHVPGCSERFQRATSEFAQSAVKGEDTFVAR